MTLLIGVTALGACSPDPLPAEAVDGSEARLTAVVDEIRQVMFQTDFVADHHAAECMRAQGFEYWPTPTSEDGLPQDDLTVVDFGSADEFWAVVNQPEAEPFETTPAATLSFRRNAEYLDALDEVTADAYHTALIGDMFASDSIVIEAGGGTIQTSASGCLTEARLRVVDGMEQFILLSKLHFDFEDTLFELDDRVSANNEYVEGGQELDSCLRSRGFDFQGVQMRIRSFINVDHGAEGTEAIFACAEELNIRPRLDVIEDRVAYQMLESPELEALVFEWEENRQTYLDLLAQAEAELLGQLQSTPEPAEP